MDEEQVKRIVREIVRSEFSQIVGQSFLLPDIVKQRHVGEGVRYIRAGLAADRPTSGEKTGAVWFSTNTNVLSIWNGTSWTSHTIT